MIMTVLYSYVLAMPTGVLSFRLLQYGTVFTATIDMEKILEIKEQFEKSDRLFNLRYCGKQFSLRGYYVLRISDFFGNCGQRYIKDCPHD